MSKEYPVKCSTFVKTGSTLKEDYFQKRIIVVSPKTGRELHDIRIDYLSAKESYRRGPEVDSREATFQKLLNGFESAERKPSRSGWFKGNYEDLSATIMLTAEDLRNIFNAYNEWQDRQMDYAD